MAVSRLGLAAIAARPGIGLRRTMPRPAGHHRPGHLCGQSSVWMRGWRDYEMLSRGPRGGARYSRSVKEVIQPQVPLRLPCYDFAPVTALAFGRLAPCGFRHGLRALTASMA